MDECEVVKSALDKHRKIFNKTLWRLFVEAFDDSDNTMAKSLAVFPSVLTTPFISHAVQSAVKKDWVDVLELLIARSELDPPADFELVSLLTKLIISSITRRRIDTVRILLKRTRLNALMIRSAVSSGCTELVELFLTHPTITHELINIAVLHAAISDRAIVSQLLVYARGNFTLADYVGCLSPITQPVREVLYKHVMLYHMLIREVVKKYLVDDLLILMVLQGFKLDYTGYRGVEYVLMHH